MYGPPHDFKGIVRPRELISGNRSVAAVFIASEEIHESNHQGTTNSRNNKFSHRQVALCATWEDLNNCIGCSARVDLAPSHMPWR